MKSNYRFLALALAVIMILCGCGSDTPNTPDITDTPDSVDYGSGNPWVNADIEENVRASYDTDLKDNYALAVNRDWILENSLKDGEISNAYLSSFMWRLQNRLIEIATDTSYENNYDAQLVSAYYNAFLDWDSRDAAGVQPVLPFIEEINSIEGIEDVYNYSVSAHMTFADLYEWEITVSPEDATRQIIYITSPRTFLNDAADYENLDNMDDYTMLDDKCNKNMVRAVLCRCGYSDKEVDDIYAGSIQFEKIFNQYCYTNDEYYRTETTDVINKQLYTVDEAASFDGVQIFLDELKNWGVSDISQIQFYEKIDYFQHLNDIYCEENIELMKDYLIAHTAYNVIDMLDKELYYEFLDITNELRGATGYKSEEEMAISVISDSLGWPLSKLYCDRFVTKEDKQVISDIIAEVIDEYKVMISEEDFLSDETKANAINKLDNMAIKCMYPDEWYDYSELKLDGTYFDMCQAISMFETRTSVEEFSDEMDREKWTHTPITVNAFYNSRENSINILPGLIGDVLYNDSMQKEEVYAMIGAVIGHEISHGFDPNGAMYDEVGNYSNWWTKEDYEAFDLLTDKLVKYYDNITIWEGFNCNGELVKGEACADMAGVACMLRLAEKDANFDYDLFFRSYSKLWAANSSANWDYYVGGYDEHPLEYLRVNVVVAQFDEFYETYDIKEGDGMYIAPEDRVKIW